MEGVEIPNSILKIITITLMALLLYGAIHLLQWAVDTKIARSDVTTTSDVTAEFREHQMGCLAKNVYYEAGSEPFEGKAAVAQVTLNRVNSGKFPGDVCKTIFQKNVVYDKVICQFSWACDRVVKFNPVNNTNYNESVIAAKKVLMENYKLPSLEKALYYHADYIDPKWGKKPIAHIGHHIFYN
jgi:spore germination cell wall hydrolase CwlJ-like protein